MANFINSIEKERIKEKVTDIFDHLEPNIKKRAVRNLVSLFEELHIKHEELENSKVSNAEIKLLLQEMRAGFELMDKRFGAVDKRFESVDKRFEAVDKRFEDLKAELEAVKKKFSEIKSGEYQMFLALLKAEKVTPIIIPKRK